MDETAHAARITCRTDSLSDSLALLRSSLPESLPRLRRFARALAHDVHDADDLVQLTLERALTRLGQWQPQGGQDMTKELLSWIFAIMKNGWLDELRSRKRRAATFAPEEAGLDVGDTSSESHQDAMAIQAVMTRLPDEQRLAVALVLIEGLSYKEAAAVMDLPVGTLTSRLARGREALAAMLSDPPVSA